MSISFLTPEQLYQSARVRYVLASNQAIATGDIYQFANQDTITFETSGNWSISSGAVTIPVDGTYSIFTSNLATGNFTAGARCDLEVDRGSGFSIERWGVADSSTNTLAGSWAIKLMKGDKVRIKHLGQSNTLSSASSSLEISRIPDYSHRSPVGFALADANRAGLLSAYEEGTFSTTFNNWLVSNPTLQFRYTRIGNTVTLHHHVQISGANKSGTANATSVSNLPAHIRPSAHLYPVVWGKNNNVSQALGFGILTTGQMIIYRIDESAWTNGAIAVLYSFSVTYTID